MDLRRFRSDPVLAGALRAALDKTSSKTNMGSVHRSVLVGLTISAAAAGSLKSQSPELSMRDFSSSQIKKGVRSIGFGGDGATWGNYAFVWKDTSTALVDYGDTQYGNGNAFHFTAVGLTSPALWHGLAVYVVAMAQGTNQVQFDMKASPFVGSGSDHAIFSKIAMPIAAGLSAGILLAYETSGFDAAPRGSSDSVHFETRWRPSAGFGVTWQPNKIILIGFRALLNRDLDRRSDSTGVTEGVARSNEYRLGVSASPWAGALLDAGGTWLARSNTRTATHTSQLEPNLGFEQTLAEKHLALRFGLDETSPTAGLTIRLAPCRLDLAYVHDMASSRVQTLFGRASNSGIGTFTLDYGELLPH